jgi:hypothetical protein
VLAGPQVGAACPLAEAVQAFRAKAAGGIPGRIILLPRPPRPGLHGGRGWQPGSG